MEERAKKGDGKKKEQGGIQKNLHFNGDENFIY